MTNRWGRAQHSSGRRRLPGSAATAIAALTMVLVGCGASGKNAEPAPSSSSPSSSMSSTTTLPDPTTSITPTTLASTTAATAAPLPQPTSPPPVITTRPAGRVVDGLDAFKLPSGNIQCVLIDDFVGCEISNRTWDAPPFPDDCEGEWGDRIEMEAASPPRFGCHGDTVRGDWPVLAYGTTAVSGPISCTSTRSGLTCTRTDGRGFSLSRGSYRIF